MLEQSVLVLRPWSNPAGEGHAPRIFIDAEDAGPTLGFAHWQPTPDQSWLQRLVERPVLTVHEMDDEPLLMSLHKGWNWRPSWEVCDAEGETVGRVHGSLLLDPYDRPMGKWRWSGDRKSGVIGSAEQGELARVHIAAEGHWLRFTEQAPSPFVRMVLLAAALVHGVV